MLSYNAAALIGFCAELPALLLHITVTACILDAMVGNVSQLKTAFFIVYVVQSIADMTVYFTVGKCGSKKKTFKR